MTKLIKIDMPNPYDFDRNGRFLIDFIPLRVRSKLMILGALNNVVNAIINDSEYTISIKIKTMMLLHFIKYINNISIKYLGFYVSWYHLKYPSQPTRFHFTCRIGTFITGWGGWLVI